MAGYFILGTLAAFGFLSIFWAVLGWILPEGRGIALVCVDAPDEGILSRCRWLRDLGLLRCPLLVVSGQEESCRENELTETISPEALVLRLREERYGIDGTGNGNSSGRHQRRGISEL